MVSACPVDGWLVTSAQVARRRVAAAPLYHSPGCRLAAQQVYKRYVTNGGTTETYRLIACFEEEPGAAAITQAFQESAKQEGN